MTLIIAEAGVNHNGDIRLAKKLIDVASEAGADIIKFQTFKASKLTTKKAKKAEYQIFRTDSNENQYEMLEKLELSNENHYEHSDYCKHKNIEFLTTAFDVDSLKFINSLNIKRFKIPSGEITNLI